MHSNQPQAVVCRLLGGSGRASLHVVPTVKLPALFAPIRRPVADAMLPRDTQLLAA